VGEFRPNSSKVAFITGGNRGIGFETARALGALGISVVIGARDSSKGKAAAAALAVEGFSADFLAHNALDPDDRLVAYDYFSDCHGKLDILINNAAVWLDTASASAGPSNTVSTISEADLRETFEVNFFAPVLLTRTLLPLLRKSPAGRIVNLSSTQGSHTLHSDRSFPGYGVKAFAYDASKAALNALTTHLAADVQDTSIKVNSVHPGWVRTEMGGESAMLDLAEGSRSSVHFATLPPDGPNGGFYHGDKVIPW
jgi:NAD(P)-dependent dehydrogenase (short-subunit alcohol dehydrogenase family)